MHYDRIMTSIEQIQTAIRNLSRVERRRLLEQMAHEVAQADDLTEAAAEPLAPRPLGIDAGRIRIAPDLDDPLPEELLLAFTGES